VNPIEPTIENQLSEESNMRWLQRLHEIGDIDGLCKAAVSLNKLYHLERTKTSWAIREAADNLRQT
jgi:hypothetical protein